MICAHSRITPWKSASVDKFNPPGRKPAIRIIGGSPLLDRFAEIARKSEN